MKMFRAAWVASLYLCAVSASADESAGPLYVPYQSSNIYALGETAGWHVTLPWGSPSASYVIRKNNLEEIGRGKILPGKPTSIEAKLDEPGMVYVEVTENSPGAKPKALGAAVAPEKIRPSIPAPADFDAFWKTKIALLRKVPAKPELTAKPSEKDGVDFAILKMNHLDGKHIWGQVAKPHDPTDKKKFPGLVILQWASPPYPLQKPWVTDRAAEGWLALDVDSHDMAPDQATAPRDYASIGNDNRETSYFLNMYLRDTRALDYIQSRPDWDGRTIVVMGMSMGGQQSIATAGLNPGRVTAMLINVPAGADFSGDLHGSKRGYPNWTVDDPKVVETARYFDAANFAPAIKAQSLVAFGFIDTTSPPYGVLSAFNQIKGPKEAAPMPDSDHNNVTPQQEGAWIIRSREALGELRAKGSFTPDHNWAGH